MTITDLPITAITAPITLDLYKDIHKGIRVELFSVTTEAGQIDPSEGVARAALASHVADVVHSNDCDGRSTKHAARKLRRRATLTGTYCTP